MTFHTTVIGRSISQLLVFSMLMMSVPPAAAREAVASPIRIRQLLRSPNPVLDTSLQVLSEFKKSQPDWEKVGQLMASLPAKPQPTVSRALTEVDMADRKGKLAVNPYVAGSQKWSVNYNGIDMLTGNFSTSASDLSFEGGYGIPINVTRTYSSNNPDPGPLGVGWTISVDIRTTAGGVLKSPGAPIRSIPVKMFDRPVNEKFITVYDTTPNPMIMTEGVVAEDAGGFQEQIQRDVDGILSTPPWDSNVYQGAMERDELTGMEYWVNTAQVMTTPEGTVYEYEEKGSYTYGAKSAFDESGSPTRTPSNILKIKRITDRHGNQTVFYYDDGTASYSKATGAVVESKLSKVSMPGGRELHFVYSSGRITQIKDGTTSECRAVNYAYTDGYLTSVTTGVTVGSGSGGLTTTYAYGAATVPNEEWSPNPVASGLLREITDPRGLTTKIRYMMGETRMTPYTSWYGVYSPMAYVVNHPNGIWSWVVPNGFLAGGSSFEDEFDEVEIDVPGDIDTESGTYVHFQDRIGNGNGTLLNDGALTVDSVPSTLTSPFVLTMKDLQATTKDGATSPAWPGLPSWTRSYNIQLMALDSETRYTYPWQVGDLGGFQSVYTPRRLLGLRATKRSLLGENDDTEAKWMETTTVANYNFMGAPLDKTVSQKIRWDGAGSSSAFGSDNVVEYAYHDADRYFQQKAVRVKTGSSTWRYSYTDYYTSSQYTSGAARGMTKYVYDSKYGGITMTGGNWRTGTGSVAPTSGQHAAEFKYDDKGRVTEVNKLQTVTSGPTYNRVKTTTSYNADDSPGWGLPETVVEDDGGLDRTTTTTAYDRAGRAVEVEDAAGRVFETVYNQRGQVETVVRTDGDDIPIVTYTYGTSGISNGMMVSVYDEISGAVDDIDYYDDTELGGNLGRLGQVQSVYNDPGFIASDYQVDYDYNSAGEREKVTYYSPGSVTTQYKYRDYVRVGSPESPQRAFQTMTLLSSGSATSEEFHYQFDTSGRMTHAVFAQSSQNGSYPYYPDTANPTANTAARRAHAIYDYRPNGQLDEVRYGWQNWSSGYSDTLLRKVAYAYDDYKGLRTSASFYISSNGTSWDSPRVEEYSYDSDLDYLTGVDYNDGLSNEVQTWYYDAAGNRFTNSGLSDHTYDNLNRMTASVGSLSYTNDILGNRLWRNPESGTTWRYTWDNSGRLTQAAGNAGGANYAYRADGMRTKKVTGLTIAYQPPEDQDPGGFYNESQDDDYPTHRYYYDGQMCFEDDFTSQSSGVSGTAYALGARGIDMMRPFTTSGSRSYSDAQFPIYDGHGNMKCTISRSGSSPYYSIANSRHYDVWGGLRPGSGNESGNPNVRYCANLGHKQDDESGLIYMRARYCEPGTGRFVSQDSALDGRNWFIYCSNDPVGRVDRSGKVDFSCWAFLAVLWHGMICLPLADNPFMQGAMNDFNGFVVEAKWLARAAEYYNPGHSYDVGNGLSLSSLLQVKDWSFGRALGTLRRSFFSLTTSVMSIMLAQSLMYAIALASCDMAFEEGI